MTQHLSPQDTADDQRIMRRLALVVGCFFVFSVALAVGVGIAMG